MKRWPTMTLALASLPRWLRLLLGVRLPGKYKVGDRVRITLQGDHVGREARVTAFHSEGPGQTVYWLENTPGLWHEKNLEATT